MKIRQLAHLCLRSGDLSATESYYCKCLGLKKHFLFYKNGEVFGFYLDCGNRTYIEVFAGEAEHPVGVINHLCLEVDSIDGVRELLIENNYECTEKILGADNSWQCWSNDPDGTRIEFHEYTAKSSQHTREQVRIGS